MRPAPNVRDGLGANHRVGDQRVGQEVIVAAVPAGGRNKNKQLPTQGPRPPGSLQHVRLDVPVTNNDPRPLDRAQQKREPVEEGEVPLREAQSQMETTRTPPLATPPAQITTNGSP